MGDSIGSYHFLLKVRCGYKGSSTLESIYADSCGILKKVKPLKFIWNVPRWLLLRTARYRYVSYNMLVINKSYYFIVLFTCSLSHTVDFILILDIKYIV